MRVLVVDDDAIVRASCKRILGAAGHPVTTASNAAEALQVLVEGGFDVLVVDVKMPVRDGYSLMQEVRARWPRLPVIVTSGYPTEETVVRSHELGATGFLPKPFTPGEMLDALAPIREEEEST